MLFRTFRCREADRAIRMPSEHGSDREHSCQGYADAALTEER